MAVAGETSPETTAFVLGGGGILGASEVGMLQALAEAGIRPDLVLGTSVGALNGAYVAADPGPDGTQLLVEGWKLLTASEVFSGSILSQLASLARYGTHLHDNRALRDLIESTLPVRTIEELAVPFQCVAASVERTTAHWFSSGPVADAVLASCAVPGLLPPVEIDGEHFFDGGLVHSIPVGRAVQLGATRIYVMHVGRIERGLTVPTKPWEVAMTAFEIARRHRFSEEMANIPNDVRVHLLPTGGAGGAVTNVRYRNTAEVASRIQRAYEASARYLQESAGRG
jgi:NTE family protein